MSFTLLVPTTGRVTSPFGMRYHPIHKEMRMHKGVDIAQPGKHLVVAAAAGTVIRIVRNRTEGYGNFVILRHRLNGIGFETLYAHLDSIVSGLVVGKSVKPGETLGVQGNTGASKGQHLHFEVHIPAYAPYQPNVVDPMNYISWPAIRSAQEQLNKAGYKLTVDGIEGPMTIAAIKDFQRKNKLTVDGKAGPVTMAALTKANEPKKEVIQVSNPKEAPLTTAQEATRQEAMRLGITDGKNARSTPNNHYLWSAMIPVAQEVEKLRKIVEDLQK